MRQAILLVTVATICSVGVLGVEQRIRAQTQVQSRLQSELQLEPEVARYVLAQIKTQDEFKIPENIKQRVLQIGKDLLKKQIDKLQPNNQQSHAQTEDETISEDLGEALFNIQVNYHNLQNAQLTPQARDAKRKLDNSINRYALAQVEIAGNPIQAAKEKIQQFVRQIKDRSDAVKDLAQSIQEVKNKALEMLRQFGLNLDDKDLAELAVMVPQVQSDYVTELQRVQMEKVLVQTVFDIMRSEISSQDGVFSNLIARAQQQI
ncbi:UNKNOWN [Stylonychia lemnae]|uniref:Uncharacterized protein n=1 Tax=Stylonychia lemnae TaxID=5949 RepID=A0A077ZMD4_STYLE|nr:UNKNOWN [Stylonychia lemnae]|eukprot:CDW71137.1 UNKNOWN [Stylonychia lemnae]